MLLTPNDFPYTVKGQREMLHYYQKQPGNGKLNYAQMYDLFKYHDHVKVDVSETELKHRPENAERQYQGYTNSNYAYAYDEWN